MKDDAAAQLEEHLFALKMKVSEKLLQQISGAWHDKVLREAFVEWALLREQSQKDSSHRQRDAMAEALAQTRFVATGERAVYSFDR